MWIVVSKLGSQAWQQAPLPAEPSRQHGSYTFKQTPAHLPCMLTITLQAGLGLLSCLWHGEALPSSGKARTSTPSTHPETSPTEGRVNVRDIWKRPLSLFTFSRVKRFFSTFKNMHLFYTSKCFARMNVSTPHTWGLKRTKNDGWLWATMFSGTT